MGFVLEIFGIGLEIDDVSAVFLLGEDFLHGGFAPLIRIGLCFFYRLCRDLCSANTPLGSEFFLPAKYGR